MTKPPSGMTSKLAGPSGNSSPPPSEYVRVAVSRLPLPGSGNSFAGMVTARVSGMAMGAAGVRLLSGEGAGALVWEQAIAASRRGATDRGLMDRSGGSGAWGHSPHG